MIRDERGTSILELILVIAIIGLVVSVLARTLYQVVTITDEGNAEMVVQHDLRNAATWLNRDVLSASKAEITQETDDYQMVLDVPYPYARTTYITYTYSAETGTLTRDSADSSFTIARNIAANPFPYLPGTTIEAPDVVTVILGSTEGNVHGSGTFDLKMRAGGSIAAKHLCRVTGADNLDIDPPSKTARWDITNNGDTSPAIDEIYITWPITNGRLGLINFGTNTIWAGVRDPTSATISGPWLGGFESREIVSGTQKTLEFGFDSDAVDDEGLYSIAITLTDKCTFSFPPNP
jgi:type II secretory pathway pseudopilin PulG